MQIISAREPRLTETGDIDLLVVFDGIGEVPFTASLRDLEQHGRDLYARAMLGEFGDVMPYTGVEQLEDLFSAKMEAINNGKNRALDAGFLFTVGEGAEARDVLFDTDAKARLAYLELAVKLGQDSTYSTPWKASRGQWVTMGAALFAALQPAYEAHISGCFAWQAAKEQEVAAALSLVTPALDAEGAETGEMDERAARAALAAIPESM